MSYMPPRYTVGALVQLQGNTGKVTSRVRLPYATRWRYIVELAPGVEMGAWEWDLEDAAAVSSPVVAGPRVDDAAVRFSLMELD